MNNKGERFAIKRKIIIKSVWLLAAIVVFIFGATFTKFALFTSEWFAWGFMCAILLIGKVLKLIGRGTRAGAESGATSYTVSSSGYISNHPFIGALFGFIIAIAIGLAIGPLWLAVEILLAIVYLIKRIIELKNTPKIG